ncbi:MAG TPA: type 4a pilus biogenesis protein PilO [Candidatus Sulfotelmatobacter sp.]|nr:type 4a pilus biogenesis protein PilO [Candidatus Sulfotelmatobacter sp.]
MALDIKSYFANLPKKQLYFMAAGVAVLLVVAYGYVLMWPMWEQRGKLQGDLAKLQDDLTQKKMIAANRSKLQADIKTLEQQLQAALVKLPEEKDIPRLLTQVNTLGQQNGLEFLLFRPGTPAKKGFYAEVPIEMRVEATYHALGGFLDRVSKLERIVNVTDIKLTPLTGQRSERTIVADLKATTFTFLEKGGSASAPAKK